MNWDRTQTIALAKEGCAHCDGEGLRITPTGKSSPCNCVLRGIFRACYARFRHCASKEKFMSKITIVPYQGKDGKRSFARLDEEYIADFNIISRRTLDELEMKIFRYHFILGADWRLCCRYMKLERGAFFHIVYRIQQKLGRAFRETEPYSLFPLDEYFGGTIDRPNLVILPPLADRRKPVRPPLRKAA
ncbi:MAG: hypothetical protein ABIZ80_07260 [Bryobacteraceae bacterium]